MSLQLRKVADEIVLGNLDHDSERVRKLLEASPDSSARKDPARHARNLARAAFAFAADLYQLERPDEEVLDNLRISAKAYPDSVLRLGPPQGEIREPNHYERAIAMVYCFGDVEGQQRILTATDEQIFSPRDSESAAVYAPWFQYLLVVRDYLRTGTLDTKAANNAVALCNRDNVWKHDRVNTLNKLNALSAIDNKDQQGFNGALQIMVDDHKNESLRGELQKQPDANIAMPIMLLVKLGQRKAVACTIQSPYLPLQFLEPTHG